MRICLANLRLARMWTTPRASRSDTLGRPLPTLSTISDTGYIRQGYSTRGIGSGTGDWVVFRFLSQPEAQTRSTLVNVPFRTSPTT